VHLFFSEISVKTKGKSFFTLIHTTVILICDYYQTSFQLHSDEPKHYKVKDEKYVSKNYNEKPSVEELCYRGWQGHDKHA